MTAPYLQPEPRVTDDGLVDAPIASTPLPCGEDLRVSLTTDRSSSQLHCRLYYRGRSSRWRRKSGAGFTIPVSLLPWLLDVLRKAEARAIADGLLSMRDYDSAGLDVPPELGEAPA